MLPSLQSRGKSSNNKRDPRLVGFVISLVTNKVVKTETCIETRNIWQKLLCLHQNLIVTIEIEKLNSITANIILFIIDCNFPEIAWLAAKILLGCVEVNGVTIHFVKFDYGEVALPRILRWLLCQRFGDLNCHKFILTQLHPGEDII